MSSSTTLSGYFAYSEATRDRAPEHEAALARIGYRYCWTHELPPSNPAHHVKWSEYPLETANIKHDWDTLYLIVEGSPYIWIHDPDKRIQPDRRHAGLWKHSVLPASHPQAPKQFLMNTHVRYAIAAGPKGCRYVEAHRCLGQLTCRDSSPVVSSSGPDLTATRREPRFSRKFWDFCTKPAVQPRTAAPVARPSDERNSGKQNRKVV
jgi:hypothetical protein